MPVLFGGQFNSFSLNRDYPNSLTKTDIDISKGNEVITVQLKPTISIGEISKE
jgi:hypothetical protein